MKPLSRPHCVLIVCYDFPGIGTAGVIRTYQFAKNLSSFGWQPIILTAQPCSGNQAEDIEYSDGRLDCPKVTVRAPTFLVPFQTDYPELFKPTHEGSKNGNGLLKPAVRFLTQLALPDGKIGWLRRAVRCALQVAQEYPLKMCFSVSPRPTSHLVARRVARSLGIPWVADFALPWSDADWLSGRPRLIKRMDQRLEGSVLRDAHHVTVAYADIARGMSARYGSAWEKKIAVVPTGFSDDLFTGECVPTLSKFRVVYPGSHFCDKGRYGECFLQAIDGWIAKDPRLADQVEFVFMGKRDDELLRRRTTMTHAEVIRIEPPISHRACVQAILSSHMCVVNAVGNRIPDKAYECMRAGKWILALTDRGSDLENLMHRYSRGISVSARDQSAIRNALQSVWQGRDMKQSEQIEADPAVASCSSKHSAEMVARIFDGLLLS